MTEPRALPPRGFMRAQWRIHKLMWNVSGGRFGRRVGGMPVLELVTTGWKSGASRHILIWYIQHDDGFALAGTNAGADRDPAWVKNLRADPEARVRVDGRWSDVRARFLEGAEHDLTWQRFLDADDGYADYAAVLTRPVPLVVLQPR